MRWKLRYVIVLVITLGFLVFVIRDCIKGVPNPPDIYNINPNPYMACYPGDNTLYVLDAMKTVSSQEEGLPLEWVMAQWDQEGQSMRIAHAIKEAAVSYNVDPLLLVAIAWRESRFNQHALGDRRNGVYRSCGMTQIRTDFTGRPDCDTLVSDYYLAFNWSAKFISEGRLARYNGQEYASAILQIAENIRGHLWERKSAWFGGQMSI
jgi:hypothetical protein